METYEIILIAIASFLGLVILGMILRCLFYRQKKIEQKNYTPLQFDSNKLANHLSEAVKIPTVTMVEEFESLNQPFIDFQNFLKKTYPLFHKETTLTVINGYSLVYHLKGTDSSLLPACFLSHQDVVPATNEGWDYPPFEGKITDDGFIYGRGSQDMKGHMIALLEAMESLIENGTEFNRDIYFCFGHDEEPATSFEGAPKIVEYFLEKGIRFEFVFDEGGTVIDGKPLGIKNELAMIGICEKGNSDIEISVNIKGGHASNPKRKTAVGELGRAIAKIQKHPMPTRWTKATINTFKALAPYSSGVFKFFFVNRAILSPLLKKVLTVATSMTNALVRTTFSPTMLFGASSRNTLPYEAKVNLNTRIITGETIDDVVKYLKKLLGKKFNVNPIAYTPPTACSDINSYGYTTLKNTITEVFGAVTIPYMFFAATDSRFYSPLSDNIFKFGPFMFGIDDQNRIHGINERLSKQSLEQATIFFARFIENSCTKQ